MPGICSSGDPSHLGLQTGSGSPCQSRGLTLPHGHSTPKTLTLPGQHRHIMFRSESQRTATHTAVSTNSQKATCIWQNVPDINQALKRNQLLKLSFHLETQTSFEEVLKNWPLEKDKHAERPHPFLHSKTILLPISSRLPPLSSLIKLTAQQPILPILCLMHWIQSIQCTALLLLFSVNQ